jgi:hypothetical protein
MPAPASLPMRHTSKRLAGNTHEVGLQSSRMPPSQSRKARFYWVSAVVVAAVGWVIFAYALTPFVIERAYRGESLPVFNHMINGQSHIPVTEYLARWWRLTTKISCVLAVLGTYLVLGVLWLTKADSSGAGGTAVKVAMSKPRLLVVYALGAVIFGGVLMDMVRDTEHWPYSPFSMDSELYAFKTFSMLRLYGVVQRSPLVEIQLDKTPYILPFDNSRLSAGLDHALRVHREDEAVADCLSRYETLRQAGRHAGPPLVAMRLYMVTWILDPKVGNIDRPERKELLAEVVSRPEGKE